MLNNFLIGALRCHFLLSDAFFAEDGHSVRHLICVFRSKPKKKTAQIADSKIWAKSL